MNFDWTTDQQAVMDAVHRIAQSYGSLAMENPARTQYSQPLQQQIFDSGLYCCLAEPALGAVTALGTVMALSAPAVCADLVGSLLLAPMVGVEGPKPCVLMSPDLSKPTRYLPMAATAVRIHLGCVQSVQVDVGSVDVVESIFAYPLGRFLAPETLAWQSVPGTDALQVKRLWRLGLAAEMVGSLRAALSSVVEHVRERRQFGRPLGTFQAVQHRLAHSATLIEGASWLCLHAAHTAKESDALLAVGQVQHISTTVCYDLHQFMGAMGLTLEHPLHRWTYRVKFLRSEWGGSAQHHAEAADAVWCQKKEGDA